MNEIKLSKNENINEIPKFGEHKLPPGELHNIVEWPSELLPYLICQDLLCECEYFNGNYFFSLISGIFKNFIKSKKKEVIFQNAKKGVSQKILFIFTLIYLVIIL